VDAGPDDEESADVLAGVDESLLLSEEEDFFA
jgi:hypothetical protein